MILQWVIAACGARKYVLAMRFGQSTIARLKPLRIGKRVYGFSS